MKRLFFLIAFLLFAGVARAQAPANDLHVYVVTFGPSDEIWEKFGHDALWIEDRTTGYSAAYNWGMFDFRQEHFIRRFIQGRMLYWMQGMDAPSMIQYYIDSLHRSVWVQELNLTPGQKYAIKELAETNALPQNKFYRYDYYRDNCTTRIRDAIDKVTGGALAQQLKQVQTTNTYRSHTKALTADVPLMSEGIMLLEGQHVDQPLTAWEEAFLPFELQKWIRSVKVRGADGSEQPLVMSERTLYQAPNEEIRATPPNRTIPFTLAGILLAGMIVLLGRLATMKRAGAIALAVVVTAWCAVSGILGSILTFLWFGTDHMATYRNENILQANPLSVVLTVFAALALAGKLAPRRWAVWFGLTVAGLSVLGFMIQIFPHFDQQNGDVIGLFAPVHGAVAWVLWHRWRVRQLAA